MFSDKGRGSDNNSATTTAKDDKRYRQLAHQFFGEPIAKQTCFRNHHRHHDKLFKGPHVILSRSGTEGQARNTLPTRFISGSKARTKWGSLGRCLICYSFVNRDDRKNFLGRQITSLNNRIREKAGNLQEFLRIIATPTNKLFAKKSDEKENSEGGGLFENLINRLSGRPWCLCVTCNAGVEQLLWRYEAISNIKRLEEEVNELHQKFIAAIKLSSGLAKKDPYSKQLSVDVSEGKVDGEKAVDKRGKIVLRMTLVDKVRRLLIVEKTEGRFRRRRSRKAGHVGVESVPKLEERIDIKIESEVGEEQVSSVSDLEMTAGEPAETVTSTITTCKEPFKNAFKGVSHFRSFANKPPEKLAMTPGAIRFRKLRAQYPHLSQREMKAHLQRLRLRQKIIPKTCNVKTEPEVVEQKQTSDNNDDGVNPEACSSSPLSQMEDDFVTDVMDHDGVIENGKNQLQTTPPNEFTSTEPQASTSAEPASRTGRKKKGLTHSRSFLNKPPEKLVMTATAIKFRNLRAQYPHLSQRELKAHIRNLQRQHQKVPEGSLPSRARQGSSGVKLLSTNKKDGQVYFRGAPLKMNDDGRYPCPFCDTFEPSLRKESVVAHVHRHHVDVSEGHSCDRCDKKFYYHHDLRRHIRDKHEGGIQCDVCGARLANSGAYYAHKRVKHLGIKPHVCEHCGRGFASKKDLTIHVRRHTGERPFVCHVCADAFVDKQALKLHMRRKHPKVPPEENQGPSPPKKVKITATLAPVTDTPVDTTNKFKTENDCKTKRSLILPQ